MKARTITNKQLGDKITFLQTSEDTHGKLIRVELTMSPNAQGPPLHFHTTFEERFEVLEGQIKVQLENKIFHVNKGEKIVIPLGVKHRWFNDSSQAAQTIAEVEPGVVGFENFLRIMYGLAEDGKANKQGLPKKMIHLAVVLDQGDTHIAGPMKLMNFILRYLTNKAKKNGVEEELLKTYCVD